MNITPLERGDVLEKWNQSVHNPDLIRDELLHELFEASVDQWPERTAVLCGESRLTYRELEERTNRLAHRLRAESVQGEDHVAILLPRSSNIYIALLSVLKAGAAYVPLDAETPLERVRFILQDCGAKCLITTSDLEGDLADIVPILRLDGDESEINRFPCTRLERTDTNLTPRNLCYVIYTSGTTGHPKGVQIEHHSATHLVRAESQLYGIRSDDKILQLSSVAFDASVEEMWMAFFHGATLVTGTEEIVHSGSDFSGILTRLGVTVLSCVPTFLSMLDQDIPTVRLLILGGEICPPELAARWQRPGRVVFNTYGPTETTVIATAARLDLNKPVTIGHPIANTTIVLLDEDGKPVPSGTPGEICIGGEGVARGYLNRPELEKNKFIVIETPAKTPLRLYRTADVARFTPNGELEYLGRLDDQVKVRGFRIELSEIEAVLLECPGVLTAAATVHPATQRIAAFIVPRSNEKPDRVALRQRLLDRLPLYMVPAFLDELPSLPRMTSGKIDRKKLPEPRWPLGEENRARVAPRTEEERTIVEIWQSTLQRDNISIGDNFFLDLDGHSLLAAIAVSKLRQRPLFERISVADVYTHPTVEALARLAVKTAEPHGESEKRPFHSVSTLGYLACMAGQALGVLILAGVYAWQWLGAFLTYGYLAVEDWPIPRALLVSLLVYCITTPAVLLLSVLLKWFLLGEIQPGTYPLWGWYYWRFWFVRSIVRAAAVPYLAGTPFINLYYRLMGARIGRDVYIASSGLATFDVLTVGNGSSIGVDTNIDGASVENGLLTISPITIGQRCWIGNRCSLGANTVMENDAGLDDLSMLTDGACIPSGELWRGSPATAEGRLESETPNRPWSAVSCLAQLVGIFAFPLVILAGFFPGLIAITYAGHLDEGYSFLVGAPLVALSFVVLLCLEVWIFKWLLLGKIREGRYPVGGSFHVRLWFYDQLMELSLDVIGTFYTTLYLRPWLKSLGARIGPRSEISTVRLIHPDLLTTGDECFLADDVMVGTPHVRAGWITIRSTRVGHRTFVGNSAVLPADVVLGSNVLIGALSIAPQKNGNAVPNDTAWFGSPPIRLPVRQKPAAFAEKETYRPPFRLVALRLAIEFLRIILPSTIFVILAALMIDTTDIMQDHVELGTWFMSVPVLYILAGVASIFATLILKQLLIGRYREDQKPLWCGFVWRTELVTGVYENLCVLFFLDLLRGTPFIGWVLKMFGAKVGSRCYIDTTQFTEFDLIEIGDEVALNENATIQTHLFEDRVMKMGRVALKRRSSVGVISVVLYNTQMEEGSSLGDLSLLMKGESLPAGTRWHGTPARKMNAMTKNTLSLNHPDGTARMARRLNVDFQEGREKSSNG